MKNTNPHPLVKEYFDLEQFGEALFDTTPPAPILSRHQKRVMLKNIIKPSGANFYKIGFGFAASAFATFAIIFGMAQTTTPGDTLYKLNVGGSATQVPTIEQTKTVTAELQKQQTTVETLKRTGAPVAEVKKAEQNLNKTIKSGKKLGIDVTRVLENAKNIESKESDRDSEREDEKSDNSSHDATTSGQSSSSEINSRN